MKNTTILLVVIFCALCKASFSYAQSADDVSQSLITQKEIKLNKKIEQLETSIKKMKLNIDNIPQKSEYLSLKERFIDKSNSIFNTYVANTLTAIAIILAFIGLVGAYISKVVKDRAVKSAMDTVETEVQNAIVFQKMLLECSTYANLSHHFLELSDVDFSKIIQKGFDGFESAQVNEIKTNSYLGYRLASSGLDRHERDEYAKNSKFVAIETMEDKIKRYQLKLLNNCIFCGTLAFQARKKLGEDILDEEYALLIDRVEECRLLVSEVPNDPQWYEAFDTCIFAWKMLGDEPSKTRGLKLANNICSGWKPTANHCDVPEERKQLFKVDYIS